MMTKPPLCTVACNLGTVLERIPGIEKWNVGDLACIIVAVRGWKAAYMDYRGCSYTPPEPDRELVDDFLDE